MPVVRSRPEYVTSLVVTYTQSDGQTVTKDSQVPPTRVGREGYGTVKTREVWVSRNPFVGTWTFTRGRNHTVPLNHWSVISKVSSVFDMGFGLEKVLVRLVQRSLFSFREGGFGFGRSRGRGPNW